MILQNIAQSITANHRIYLMALLIDERLEEVTDMQRSVKAKKFFNFDESHHITSRVWMVTESKRLVEHKWDVAILLDRLQD